MRKEKALFVLGIWIIIFPFLGFPNVWKMILLIVTGFMIIYIAYLFKFQNKSTIEKIENHVKSFVDNIGGVKE